jgi:heat shock protein beta
MEDAEDYTDQNVLKQLVRKYSMFINFPIYLWVGTEEEKEVPLTDEEIAAERTKKKAAKSEEDSEEIKLEDSAESTEEDDDIPTTKKVKETVYNWELMNETKPLWTRNPKDISDEEYNDFYKAISKDTTDPMMKIHFLGEGEVEFKSLLYIPEKPLANLYEGQDQKAVKLYVKRVFITDDFKDIIPRYLNFIRGIVDSDDLPLNVSREMLQESKIIDTIRRKLVRKAIAMFQTLAEDEDKSKYQKFWEKYQLNMKLGILEDAANKTRLSKLLMFHSSKTGELTFLSDYVSRMKEGQSQIYYLAGTSKEQVEKSPLLEQLISKDYEVLYMLDPIDEYALQHLDKYDGKHKLTNVAREGLKFDGEEEKKQEEDLNDLTKWVKGVLATKVEKVVVSNRLAKSPSAVVSASSGFTANMERIMKAQALHDANNPYYQAPRKVLEINPNHPLIKEMAARVSANTEDAVAKDMANLMYETALLSSGFSLDDTASFSERIVAMLERSLNIERPTETQKDEL